MPASSEGNADSGRESSELLTVYRTESGSRTVADHNIYMAFEDGAWRYDCQECGSQCCRGHGFFVGPGDELNAQLRSSPAVRLFFSYQQKAALFDSPYVKNLAPSCFHLAEQGTCGLHSTYGISSKPETCRLFPFNQFRLVEDVLVVQPHTSLCPLVPARNSALSSHSALQAEMKRSGIHTPVPTASYRNHTAGDPLALERRIAKLASAYRSVKTYEELVGQMIDVTNSHLGLDTGLTQNDGHLKNFLTDVRRVLRVWPTDQADRSPLVVDIMVVATPSLRAQMVFPRRGSEPPDLDVELVALPYLLLGLQKIVALAVDAGMRKLTYQTVASLLQLNFPLLTLISQANKRMGWNRLLAKDFRPRSTDTTRTYRQYIRAVKLLLAPLRNRLTLGEVLSEAMGEQSDGRLEMLDRLAKRLRGRLVEGDVRRGACARWIMNGVSEDLLVQAASRAIRPA